MIAAHGAHLKVTESGIRIQRSALSTALLGTARNGGADADVVDLPLAEISGVEKLMPTALEAGWVTLAGVDVRIPFAPNQAEAVAGFTAAVESALRGESPPAEGSVPGLNFVGFDVETANGDWGSICQIGVVRVIDGIEVESQSWLCAPPSGIDHFDPANVAIHGITQEQVAGEPTFADRLPMLLDFFGDLPFVAHNAHFDATSLRRACQVAGQPLPETLFACSLTLARASKLGLASHRLPVVAEALGVPLTNHHDATEDARAAALITVELARRARHRGDLMGLFHSRGFTIGSLDADIVQPVLRDRSGAGVALQARKLRAAGGGEAVSAPSSDTPIVPPKAEAATGAAQSPAPAAGSGPRRGPAPWQSVATPDVVPEPNPDADPAGILFGQNITLSGDFEPFDKGRLWSGIAELGGTVGKNVTRKTTILAAGPWATKTSKQKRAEELIDKGQEIEIWTAEQLFAALGLDEQPPF